MGASGNRVFWRWAAIYFVVAVFYTFTPDAVWETMRRVLSDQVVGGLYILLGPIVSTDFIHFFSAWPFVIETIVVLLILSCYSHKLQVRYLILLSGVWLLSLALYSGLMGRFA